MRESQFQRRLRTAIENRQSLESLGESRELDSADDREWRRQIRLNQAIDAWKRGDGQIPPRPAWRRRRGAGALVSIAAGLAIVGFTWNFGAVEQSERIRLVQKPAPAEVEAVVAPLPIVVLEPTQSGVAHFAPAAELELEPVIASSEEDAEFSQTADRLVYAFEPVGQRVSAVMHRLIDAVPGAEALAAGWQYGS